MKNSRGFTLIELLIAMVLGLVIIGSVMGVMLANKKGYRTNEGLSQVQESARTAFELIAHDVRQADSNGCVNSARTANVLQLAGAPWWQNWYGMTGYDSTEVDPAVAIGAAVGERVAGTDSISVESMDSSGFPVSAHNAGAQRIDIDIAASPTTPDIVAGDIILACDFDHATLFRASSVSSAAGLFSVFHISGGTPGNCSGGLGFPTSCLTATGNVHVFPRNAQVGRLVAVDWYIGNNGRAGEGGRSLYRQRLNTGGVVVTEEVVAGITDMQMRFRANGSDIIIADASLVTDWSAISSVLIQITALSGEVNVTTSPAVNNGRVQRTFNYLISIRSRLP
jgi:type IV pilus assembly protein PilW